MISFALVFYFCFLQQHHGDSWGRLVCSLEFDLFFPHMVPRVMKGVASEDEGSGQ